MTDPKESALEGTESSALPVPEISEPSAAQPTSDGTVDIGTLASQVTELSKRIEELPDLVARVAQSQKDKRFDKLDKLGDLAPVLEFKEKLDAAGGDWDKAIQQHQIDQFLEIARTQQATSQTDPGRSAAEIKRSAGKRAGKILRKANIPFDDPEVAALAEKVYASEDEYVDDVLALAAGRVRQAQPANPATVTTESGSPPPPQDVDAIVDALNELKRVPGYLTDPKLKAKRQVLLDQLKELDPLQ